MDLIISFSITVAIAALIATIIAVVLISEHLNASAKCSKCLKKIVRVDYWGFKRFLSISKRYRCSKHPSEGYREISLANAYWKSEIKKLAKPAVRSLRRRKEISIVIEIFPFAKIIKSYNPRSKIISKELVMDSDKIIVNENGIAIYFLI